LIGIATSKDVILNVENSQCTFDKLN